MVEVADELWVDGATELGHLSVGRGDEDPLDCLHQDVVEQRVLGAGRQSVANRQTDGRTDYMQDIIRLNWAAGKAKLPVTHFMVLYISSLSFSVRVFFRVPR